jgi:putative ABC transport system ATP-binding protein
MSLIRLQNVSRRYQMGTETVHALRDVSLEIQRGEYVAIMGPSGSGKSTMMNLIGCLDTATSGRYELNGIGVSATAKSGSSSRPSTCWRARMRCTTSNYR